MWFVPQRSAAGFLLLLLLSLQPALGMTVRVERPDWYKTLSQNGAWNVALEGPIELGDASKIERALREVGTDGADVYIASPGGNLLEGMKIGRLLRKIGANTWLGVLRPAPERSFGGRAGVKHEPGDCFSACALASLGGVYRFSATGSRYGVHRFSRSAGSAAYDLDVAQVVSAGVAAYMREMDVDAELLTLMAEQGAEGIRLLTPEEQARLSVVNNGRLKANWDVELVAGGHYLRGSQTTIYGEGKAAPLCDKGRLFYFSFYEAGVERAKEIAGGSWYHSLLLDGETVALPDGLRSAASGATVSTVFPVSKSQASVIFKATRIGHAMQLGRDAPTFVGYQIDVPKEATSKVRLFLSNCLGKL